jgi:hypothetical protein
VGEEEKAGKIRKCRVAVCSGTWLDQIVEVDEDEMLFSAVLGPISSFHGPVHTFFYTSLLWAYGPDCGVF